MSISPWADHLDIARAFEAIAEHDLGWAAACMGGALVLLQRDLALLAEETAPVRAVERSAT